MATKYRLFERHFGKFLAFTFFANACQNRLLKCFLLSAIEFLSPFLQKHFCHSVFKDRILKNDSKVKQNKKEKNSEKLAKGLLSVKKLSKKPLHCKNLKTRFKVQTMNMKYFGIDKKFEVF